MDEELEQLAWRLSSEWWHNWITNDAGYVVSCKYAVDAEGQWWQRGELKQFLQDTEVTYHKVEGPVW